MRRAPSEVRGPAVLRSARSALPSLPPSRALSPPLRKIASLHVSGSALSPSSPRHRGHHCRLATQCCWPAPQKVSVTLALRARVLRRAVSSRAAAEAADFTSRPKHSFAVQFRPQQAARSLSHPPQPPNPSFKRTASPPLNSNVRRRKCPHYLTKSLRSSASSAIGRFRFG